MIVTLMGGTANQLWQYAFGTSVAKARKEKVYFTRNRVDADVKRSYGLDAFLTEIEFAKHETDVKFHDGGRFNQDVYGAPQNTTFIGYWQSEKWLDDPLIRKHTRLAHRPSDETLRVAEEINSAKNSTFVHVRRGDYVTEKHTSAFHGNLTLEYYQRAIMRIRNFTTEETFFIFSDDPNWCRENFPGLRVVDHNHPGNGQVAGKEHEDLWLMSLCNHGILANSAFSLFGAWMGDTQKDRIVIAPRQWFQDPNMDSSDMVPERYARL
jgi:hypothetical protein